MGFVCFLLSVGLLVLGFFQYRTQKRLNAVAQIADQIADFGVIDV